ncbi:winged helix-turn-helix domain-containing protein [Sutcliffiella rhizosphaerae]|uniref:OmpR/PhoB-type domain-containing protein n=1 Tax=Sutcliffiella rhizosphaerae TaxID=2880967 RepID=A0ABN8AEW6_9BACI|nr:helix-turn-helix domain-containing protein [Sutcliffiella rhizosphaerae]CAG9622774.1 hypothetical protein BACCIP111883_03565 [Sutcliffiella rhizosphaerae]
MSQYISVLTTNTNLFKLLETFYSKLNLKLIFEIESSLEDKDCLLLLWDYTCFKDLFNISHCNSKPVILLNNSDNIITTCTSLINLHAVFNNYPTVNRDFYRLNNNVVFSIEKHCIIAGNTTYMLTNLEFRLLYYLLKLENKFVSTETLLEKLDLFSPSSLYVCIKKLREKIEINVQTPTLLIYHKNKGYCLKIDNINKNLVYS